MISAMSCLRGKFLKEGKTRFVAWCEVDGCRRKCYVPMSTKLSRYFDPVGREVRLEAKGIRLWVEQIKFRGKWVWVEAAKAVELLRKELERHGKTVETEKTVGGYRFDIWCEGVGYEVKSVLSGEKEVVYPNAPSGRRDEQLRRLRLLLRKGQKVVWVFVVLSSSSLRIDKKSCFGRNLLAACREGLEVQGWRTWGSRLSRCEIELV